jgi:hypothetical protein
VRILTSGLTAVALLLLTATGASAQAADVEGVWTFGGGQVAVQDAGDGTHKGTVIRETVLATCAHPVGETMWLGMRPQPDGQWWGGHQWYNNADCSPIAQRGNTAFRVLTRPDGSRFLRVCFAGPENPELQPTIAPDGTSANTTTECDDSDFVRPVPEGKPGITQIATLPKQGKKKCLSKRKFKIRLREPEGDALKRAVVRLNGKVIRTRTGERITAPISLKGLPKGRYTLKITATTVLGKTISGTRKYRTCVPKRRSGNRIRV